MDIYFDNSATTPMCVNALNAYVEASRFYGNPSSLHSLGSAAKEILEDARRTVAGALRARNDEIFFTSGGTESNNLAIFGGVNARKRLGNRIVTTATEHSSVFEAMLQLQKQGFEVVFIRPYEDGILRTQDIINAVTENTVLISLIHTNSETGAYSPLSAAAKAIDNISARTPKRPLFHIDAVQAFGKEDINVSSLQADLVSVSSHKVFGPKGIGALFVRKTCRITPLLFGGSQEASLRPGTEPVQQAAAFAAAVKDFGDFHKNAEKVKLVKERIIAGIKAINLRFGREEVIINSPENGSPYILNISAGTVKAQTMLHFLESRGIFVSTGSACDGGKRSRVLTECGIGEKRADSALRLSFSKHNTQDSAEAFLKALEEGLLTLARAKR